MKKLELTGKRQYDPYIAKCNLMDGELSEKKVLSFLEDLKQSPKNYSLNYLRLAKFALKYSIRKTFLNDQVILASYERAIDLFVVKVQKTKVRQEDLISEEEMLELEKFLPIKKFLVCLFFYITGVRASELCQIRISDCVVKNENVEIQIHGKGRRKRHITIPKYFYFTIIKKYISVNYLFETQKKERYRTDSIQKTVSRHAKKILGRRIYPHLFRHTFITNQIKKNVTATALAEYVGNSANTIYNVYCHDKADHSQILNNIEVMKKFTKVAA